MEAKKSHMISLLMKYLNKNKYVYPMMTLYVKWVGNEGQESTQESGITKRIICNSNDIHLL